MRKRIYIETTIPSFYYTRREDVHEIGLPMPTLTTPLNFLSGGDE